MYFYSYQRNSCVFQALTHTKGAAAKENLLIEINDGVKLSTKQMKGEVLWPKVLHKVKSRRHLGAGQYTPLQGWCKPPVLRAIMIKGLID